MARRRKWRENVTEREEFVLTQREAGQSLAQIAESLGVSRERVRQIEAKALKTKENPMPKTETAAIVNEILPETTQNTTDATPLHRIADELARIGAFLARIEHKLTLGSPSSTTPQAVAGRDMPRELTQRGPQPRFTFRVLDPAAVPAEYRASGGSIDHLKLREVCHAAMETGVKPEIKGLEITDTMAG